MAQKTNTQRDPIWERVDDWYRTREANPEVRRAKEAERILSDWDDGGYLQFCQLLERACCGPIARRDRARAILPTLLEVVDEEDQVDREVERAKSRFNLGLRMRHQRGEVVGPMVVTLPPGAKPPRKMAERCTLLNGRSQR